jgi:hypothetical protein
MNNPNNPDLNNLTSCRHVIITHWNTITIIRTFSLTLAEWYQHPTTNESWKASTAADWRLFQNRLQQPWDLIEEQGS